MHGFILVVLNRTDIARVCLHAAALVADAMKEARIEALCVRLDPANAILPSEQILTKEHRARLETDAAELAGAVNRIYNTWLVESLRSIADMARSNETWPAKLP
jgi:hypothetical protein